MVVAWVPYSDHARLSVCWHNKTKTAETKITKLGTIPRPPMSRSKVKIRVRVRRPSGRRELCTSVKCSSSSSLLLGVLLVGRRYGNDMCASLLLSWRLYFRAFPCMLKVVGHSVMRQNVLFDSLTWQLGMRVPTWQHFAQVRRLVKTLLFLRPQLPKTLHSDYERVSWQWLVFWTNMRLYFLYLPVISYRGPHVRQERCSCNRIFT